MCKNRVTGLKNPNLRPLNLLLILNYNSRGMEVPQKYWYNCGLTKAHLAAVYIQALVLVDVILLSSSIKLRLLIINFSSSHTVGQFTKCSNTRTKGDGMENKISSMIPRFVE